MSDSASPLLMALPDRLTRRDSWTALGLAAVMGLCSWGLAVPHVCGAYHDDGIYLITAKALAEGEGYRLLHLPGHPAQTKYPPLLPMLLAPLWRLFPDFPANLPVLLAVPFLCGMAVIAGSYLYLVHFGYTSRATAGLAALWCATTPMYAVYGTLVMAEFPFAFLWLVTLWRLERMAGQNTSGKQELLLGILCGLAAQCRLVGVTLVPVALWVFWRNRRGVWWLLLGAGLAFGPWVIWAKTGVGDWERNLVTGYYTDYVGWWQQGTVLQLARVALLNLLSMTYAVTLLCQGWLFYLVMPYWPWNLPLLSLAGILAAGRLVGWARRGRVLPLAMGAMLALVCVWPWPPTRFLVPVAPLLTAALLATVTTHVAARFRSISVRVAGLLLVLTLMLNLCLWFDHVRITQATGYPLFYYRYKERTTTWQAQAELLAWITTHTQPHELIASEMDPMVYLYTGRPACRPYAHSPLTLFYAEPGTPLGTVEEWREQMVKLKPRFVVTLTLPFFAENQPFRELLARIRREHPAWLTPVYQSTTDPNAVIYAVHLEEMRVGGP